MKKLLSSIYQHGNHTVKGLFVTLGVPLLVLLPFALFLLAVALFISVLAWMEPH
jgi:hypothetical protein